MDELEQIKREYKGAQQLYMNAREEVAKLKEELAEATHFASYVVNAELQGELLKWKEIAEENMGEHVKLEHLRVVLGAAVDAWRSAAARVNQPDSPSIYVACADDLEAIYKLMPSPTASVVFEKARKWDAIQAWLRDREAEPKL